MIIKSYNSAVQIEGIELGDHPFIHQYIPLAEIANDDAPDCFLHISTKGNPSMSYPNATNVTANPYEVIATGGIMLRRALEEKGVYSISSSAASVDGKAVLFYGAMPDLGKTTLATMLARESAFISDERTLLEGDIVLGGIQYIKLRKPHQIKEYGRKDLIHASELFEVARDVPIGMIVYPTVCQQKLQVDKFDEGKAYWHLQEDLARSIRGTASFFGDHTMLVPCLDTENMSAARIDYAKRLASFPHFHLKGTPEEIVSFIIKEIQ